MLRPSFLREHGLLIGFGFFMCFCSSFGQTFFISWFGGEIRESFSLSHGDFGSIYSAATLTSAATLVWVGRSIDVVSLKAFSVAVVVGLAAACLLMASAWNAAMLFAAVFGLRLFGQGLVSHASMTAMGRYFRAERGRVISIASLGYNFGEAVLPRVLVAALVVIDWRTAWLAAALALVLALPMILALLTGAGTGTSGAGSRSSAAADDNDYALKDVLGNAGFWMRMPALLAPAFIYTGLIFHQVHMAETKGWSPELMAWSFSVAAVASLMATIVAGPLVDWMSARRMVPFYLTTLAAACFVLYGSSADYSAPLFFLLVGINAGFSLVLLGALWPELYGVTHLGAIRAFCHAAMVFSSGLAPAIMGVVIDLGSSFETIALWCGVYCVAASVLAWFAASPRRAVVSGAG